MNDDFELSNVLITGGIDSILNQEVSYICILFEGDYFTKDKKIKSLYCNVRMDVNDNDYKNLTNLILDEKLLNKYFRVMYDTKNKKSIIKDFLEIEEEYKKFVLDNINRAIMEYNL